MSESAPPRIVAPGARPVEAPMLGMVNSVQAELELTRFREKSYNRIMSGMYLVEHEEFHQWFRYRPQSYFIPMLQEFLGPRDVQSNVILKPRQAKSSTLWCIVLLDWLLFRSGFRGNVTAQKDSKDKDVLRTHVADRIFEMDRNGLLLVPAHLGAGKWKIKKAGEAPGTIQVKKDEIVAHHLDGRESKIDAEDPRSMNPHIMVMSEFGVLEEGNAQTANEIYEGIVALKFCRAQWETTIKGVGELFSKIYWTAKDETLAIEKRNKSGRWPQGSRKARFWGWYVIDSNRKPLEFADQHLGNREVNLYLEGVNRAIRADGLYPQLDAEQWNFLRHQFVNKFFGDWDKMWYQFPSFDYEAFKAAVSERYLVDHVENLENSGRLAACPVIATAKYDVYFDLGRNAAMVWGREANNMADWEIPVARETQSATADDCLDMIERVGAPVSQLLFPHDGKIRNAVANRMTGTGGHGWGDDDKGETVVDFVKKRVEARTENGNPFWAGVRVDTLPRVREEDSIQSAINQIGRMRIDNQGAAPLINALRRVETKNKKIVKTGEPGKASHLHDAFVLLCRNAESGGGKDFGGKVNLGGGGGGYGTPMAHTGASTPPGW